MKARVGDDLAFLSATELVERIRRCEMSPVEVVRVFLDHRLGSYVTATAERVLADPPPTTRC